MAHVDADASAPASAVATIPLEGIVVVLVLVEPPGRLWLGPRLLAAVASLLAGGAHAPRAETEDAVTCHDFPLSGRVGCTLRVGVQTIVKHKAYINMDN